MRACTLYADRIQVTALRSVPEFLTIMALSGLCAFVRTEGDYEAKKIFDSVDFRNILGRENVTNEAGEWDPDPFLNIRPAHLGDTRNTKPLRCKSIKDFLGGDIRSDPLKEDLTGSDIFRFWVITRDVIFNQKVIDFKVVGEIFGVYFGEVAHNFNRKGDACKGFKLLHCFPPPGSRLKKEWFRPGGGGDVEELGRG